MSTAHVSEYPESDFRVSRRQGVGDLLSQATGTVVTCYSIFDGFFPACGLWDLTEGLYRGDPAITFEEAQANQHQYLLDQIRCGLGARILDVGCGYGTLLQRAEQRGATTIGITLSPEQVCHGLRAGLDVRLLNYKEMGSDWDARFDGIVANGSAEHFVQPKDAVEGRADEIYRHFFRTMYRVINPASPGRLVTTTIHFVRIPQPVVMVRSPLLSRFGSDAFHYSLLAHTFGGWYPVAGQLERCAKGYFTLADEVDGTDDYCRTSEAWLLRAKGALRSPTGIKVAASTVPVLLRHPLQVPLMLFCLLGTESWNWQFRGPNPPTRLLRQTWVRCP